MKRRGELVHLTPIEYRLLALLIANAGRVLTHRQILRDVWGPAYVEHTHYVRVHMAVLRKKIESDPRNYIAQPMVSLSRRAGHRCARRKAARFRSVEEASLVGSDHAGVEPDPARPAGRPLELAELVRTRREPQAPDPLERTEALVQLDAVSAERHHRGRRVERGHEARRLTGGAGRELGLLDEQDVRPAGQREVVRDAAAGDPPADHDDLVPVLHAYIASEQGIRARSLSRVHMPEMTNGRTAVAAG